MVSQAPDTRIKEVRKAEIDRVADMNVAAYQQLNKVRKYINDRLPNLERLFSNKQKYNAEMAKLEKYLISEYGIMFDNLEGLIVDSLNASGLEQRYLAELALGSNISWATTTLYKSIPKTDPFKITNEVLSTKSVLRRNKAYARKVSKSIDAGFKANQSIKEIQKDLDIIYGFRDKQGKTTRSALKGLKEGRFSHSNGIFYDTYRVARTEVKRMADVSANNVAQELQTQYNDVRLKLIAVVDSRTRQQSLDMNKQVSDSNFTFLYPDGNRYKLGKAPAKYQINDRESSVVIFLDSR